MSRDDDRIEIRGLRVLAVHGLLPEERRPQPFSVDLTLWLDLGPAGRTDELARTVDYGTLLDLVVGVLHGPPRQLLETLAEELARAALDHDRRVGAVEVTVRKLRPPVPYDVGDVGVRVHRSRA